MTPLNSQSDPASLPSTAGSLLSRLLLGTLRVVDDQAEFKRVLWSADHLYPYQGQTHPAYKRTRYFARCVAFRKATNAWLKLMFSEPRLVGLLQQHPDLAEKVHRPYLRADFSASQCVATLNEHYRICLEHGLSALLFSAMRHGVEVARISGRKEEAVTLSLVPPDALQKEGELVLLLEVDGSTLYRLAFTLTGSLDDLTIVVGCLQGNQNEDAGALIRSVTRALSGLRPRDLLVVALQALAAGLGARCILGVSHEVHIYRNIRKRRDVMQDYNRMWLDVGGVRLDNGTYRLPMSRAQRPLSEYPSKKRAEASRRQGLIEQVREQLQASSLAALPVRS